MKLCVLLHISARKYLNEFKNVLRGNLAESDMGPDLSGSLQGAGGIGGLVCGVDNGKSYYYFFDGNGNVGQVVDDSTGDVVAHYEYDPFGKIVAQSGVYAGKNAFRFSTKYWDDETGFGYWGRRYYSANIGRWLSRDPIEETGGFNLYIFVQNSPVLFFDALGNEYSTTNAPDPYDIDYGGTGGWASPRRPDQMDPPSPVVPYIDAGTRMLVGAVLITIPEATITKAGGVLLVSDGIDKLQALIRGDKTEFEKALDNYGFTEDQKRAVLCSKEIFLLTIEVSAGFVKASKNPISNSVYSQNGKRIGNFLEDPSILDDIVKNDIVYVTDKLEKSELKHILRQKGSKEAHVQVRYLHGYDGDVVNAAARQLKGSKRVTAHNSKILPRQRIQGYEIEVHVGRTHGPHIHLGRGSSKPKFIRLDNPDWYSEVPQKLLNNERVKKAILKAAFYGL